MGLILDGTFGVGTACARYRHDQPLLLCNFRVAASVQHVKWAKCSRR